MPRGEAPVCLFDVVEKLQVEWGVLVTKLDNARPGGDSVATPALDRRWANGFVCNAFCKFVALLLRDGIVPLKEAAYLELCQACHLLLHCAAC